MEEKRGELFGKSWENGAMSEGGLKFLFYVKINGVNKIRIFSQSSVNVCIGRTFRISAYILLNTRTFHNFP